MKKIIFLLLVTALAAAELTAAAFGGTYPQSAGFLDFDEGGVSVEKGCYTPTDAERLFTVGGKQFILLDTDSEGNYFVMTEKHYGRHAFETAAGAHPVVQDAVAENGAYTFTTTPAPDNSTWIFDPNNPASVAHWLNTEFYQNGNGTGNVLPEPVKSHILERDWQVEGFKTYCGSGTRLFDRYFDGLGIKGYTPSEVIASNIVQKPYSVRCKLAFPSFSEYMAYQTIIGVSFTYSGWGGMMLRSQDAFLTTGNESLHTQLKYYFGPLQVFAPLQQNPSVKLRINVADAPNSAYYFVRPVFWLDKDFFKAVKCDISAMGKYPRQFVADNSYDGLKRIYTEDEIAAMGIVKPEGAVGSIAPSAAYVGFVGDASAGNTLYGTYQYNKNSEDGAAGLLEHLTRYQWYLSDTVQGEKHPIPNGDRLELKLEDAYAGKFLWLAVTPKNAFNNSGQAVLSKKVVKIRSNNHVTAEFLDNDGNVVTSIPANGIVDVNFRYNLPEGAPAAAYIAGYDSNRALVRLEPLTLYGTGGKTVRMELSQCAACKVIVLGEQDGAPYCIYEIKNRKG